MSTYPRALDGEGGGVFTALVRCRASRYYVIRNVCDVGGSVAGVSAACETEKLRGEAQLHAGTLAAAASRCPVLLYHAAGELCALFLGVL